MASGLDRDLELEHIDGLLAGLAPPEPLPYRCKNYSCLWTGHEPVSIWREERETNEIRCPKCGSWVADGYPLQQAEKPIEGTVIPAEPELLSHG